MMFTQTTDEQNRLDIREFLDRAPTIQIGVTLNTKATSRRDAIKFDNGSSKTKLTWQSAKPWPPTGKSGIAITGDVPNDLKEGIDEFYNLIAIDLLGQRMTEESLMLPVRLVSAFFEGIESLGRIRDYEVRFDPTRSSHLLGAVGYSIAITAINPSWWNDAARRLWDSFVDLVLDPNTPNFTVNHNSIPVKPLQRSHSSRDWQGVPAKHNSTNTHRSS